MTLAVPSGTGGRSSVSGIQAAVFGATGMLGRATVNRLGRIGSQAVIPFRCNEYETQHLKVMGDYGQIVLVPYHLQDTASIANAVQHSNVCINMVGAEWDTRNFTMADVNVEGARAIAKAAKAAGIERFIHISAMSANADSKSDFAKTKAEGEAAVKEIYPDATIIRPGSIFGNEDRFLSRIASQAKALPVFPLIDGGNAKRTPIFVDDVAHAIMVCLRDPNTVGQTYEVGGPKCYTLAEVFGQIFEASGRNPYIANVPEKLTPLLAMQGKILQMLPSSPLTKEEVLLASEDEVVSDGALTIEDLGIEPVAMEEKIGKLLLRFKPPEMTAKDAGIIL